MDSGFQCHTSTTKGGREQSHDSHTFNTAVTKKAENCPVDTSFTALGVRGVNCGNSAQPYTLPFWAAEGNLNSATEKTSCATKGSGNYSAL